MDTLTKTEQALARIFAHCDAVTSGEKPTPSVEDGEKMAAAFLGEVNAPNVATKPAPVGSEKHE